MAQKSTVTPTTPTVASKLSDLKTDLEQAAVAHARRWTLQALFNKGRLRAGHFTTAASQVQDVLDDLASCDKGQNDRGIASLREMRGHFNWRVKVQLDNGCRRGAAEDRKFERKVNAIIAGAEENRLSL